MRKMRKEIQVLIFVAAMALSASAADHSREKIAKIAKIVVQIQRADYEDDRVALKRLHEELTPFAANNDKAVAARVLYWRGFALWRRAINGFNDHTPSAELREDLKIAFDEFNEASTKDPAFADAKVGTLSCLGFLAFEAHQQRPTGEEIQEFVKQARQLRKEAEAVEPENPRLAWVLGPMVWNTPAEHGGGQGRAIEGYEKALEGIRNQKASADALQPSWGEPELLMSLAWSNLNRTTPDLNAAEQQARAALEVVPYWHYVKDILLPQILEAKKKAEVEDLPQEPPHRAPQSDRPGPEPMPIALHGLVFLGLSRISAPSGLSLR